MMVTGICQSNGYSLSLAGTPAPGDPAVEDTGAVPQAEPPEPPSPDDGGGVKGVLQLLQAGHFRGVADVRLRINFHEELAAGQTEATKATAVEVVHDLSGIVTAKLEEMASSDGLTEEDVATLKEAKQSFEEAVGLARESFLAAEEVAGQALVGALEDGYASLGTALESAFPADAAEEATEVAEGTVPETALDVKAALESLTESFSLGIAELEDALVPSSFLPELSQPTGRGVAFGKFLAVYEELLGSENTTAPEPSEPVDTAA